MAAPHPLRHRAGSRGGGAARGERATPPPFSSCCRDSEWPGSARASPPGGTQFRIPGPHLQKNQNEIEEAKATPRVARPPISGGWGVCTGPNFRKTKRSRKKFPVSSAHFNCAEKSLISRQVGGARHRARDQRSSHVSAQTSSKSRLRQQKSSE
jgi:hypothetical protein